MSRTRILFTLAGLAAVLLASASVHLYRELDRANDSLRAARTSLEDTAETLHQTRATLANAGTALAARSAANGRLRQDNAALRRDKAGLQSDKDALAGYLNGALQRNAALDDDLQAAANAHAALQGELVAAESQISALSGEKAEVEGLLGEMTQRFEASDAGYTALQAQHRRLRQAAGDVTELETRAGDLRAEIAELEERRRPLFLAMQRQQVEGFLCTGSMEPVLTCLDTATWMRDFAPGEIVVGAVINYDNSACWGDAAVGRTAHRVVDIQVIDGVHHYWPKGDAHAHPDGCWVPHTAVNGYIIEFHKNTVPANAELRDNVNAALAAYTTAWEAYLDAIEANCGHREPHRCSVSLATALGQQAQSLWRVAEAASAYYSCWYANATASQYPGHIPYTC